MEKTIQKDLADFWCWKMTLKVQILRCSRRLFIILVSLTMTCLFPLDAYMVSCPTWSKNLGRTLMPAWLSHSFDLKSTRPSTKALCSNSLSLAFFSSTQKEYYSWGCLALEASKRCWHNGPFCFSTKIIEFLHENKSTI